MEKINYTQEQTVQLVNEFKAGATLEALAEQFGKSVKSIVAKLSREGVYKAKVPAKAKRITKATLIARIAEALAVEGQVFSTLEKASYEALEILAAKVVFEDVAE